MKDEIENLKNGIKLLEKNENLKKNVECLEDLLSEK